MNISELCYELYKVEWESRNVTSATKADNIKSYYENTEPEDRDDYTYEDYLLEQGYDGMFYACYEEFLETEYLDKGYIEWLLDNDDLLNEYIEDTTN